VPEDLEQLEAERRRLYGELSQIGDLRRGSIAVNYRRCGKPNCACRRATHPGHGPQYLLMTKVGGRSRAKNLRTGSELQKVRREVANQQRFRQLVQQIVEINERICEGRPVEALEESRERGRSKKKWRRPSSRKSPGK